MLVNRRIVVRESDQFEGGGNTRNIIERAEWPPTLVLENPNRSLSSNMLLSDLNLVYLARLTGLWPASTTVPKPEIAIPSRPQ